MSQNVNESLFRWLKKKIQAIKRVENGGKLFTIAASYCASSYIVGDWHRNKTELRKFITKSALNAANRKSMIA